MSFEPQSIGDFLDDMYDLRMDEHAFGWQYNMLWKLLGLEGMPQLPDAQSFLVGTFPDYYEMVTAARSRFSLAELRENVHEYKGIIHMQGGLAQKMREAYKPTAVSEDTIRRHASLAGAELPPEEKPKLDRITLADIQGPIFQVPDNIDAIRSRDNAFARSKGVRPGSAAFFDLMMPHTPIDDAPDNEFVLSLCQMRDQLDETNQMIYGYQYERLERIIERPIKGFRRPNVKYRMSDVENIDLHLQEARERISRTTKPTLKVVK